VYHNHQYSLKESYNHKMCHNHHIFKKMLLYNLTSFCIFVNAASDIIYTIDTISQATSEQITQMTNYNK
jgi:hypothetical protein